MLDGSLPHGASFIDLDAWCEINGQFLFIEHKPAGYAWDQGNGQYTALRRLARLPGATVWFIRDLGPDFEMRDLASGEPLRRFTLEQLHDRIRWWAEEAERA